MTDSQGDALVLVFALLGLSLLFPLLWVFVSTTIAHIGGWQSLAASYRENAPFEGQAWAFQSGSMRRGMRYMNALTVGASPLGLHLSVLFPFRAGHPPLFVRWDDVTIGAGRFGFAQSFRLDFRAAPGVFLTISVGLAEKLRAHAGNAWPQAEGT